MAFPTINYTEEFEDFMSIRKGNPHNRSYEFGCYEGFERGAVVGRQIEMQRWLNARYLIVKCKELDDQWECDCDRTPMCLTDDLSPWNSSGADCYYEVYEVQPNGALTLIEGLTL